jgi:RNA-directed DNA polymerase
MKKNSIATSPLLSSVLDSKELCKLLDVSEDSFTYAVKQAPRLYRQIFLSKTGGGSREINAPTDKLKIIQRAILDKILILEPLSNCVYGFGKGRSIIENAKLHAENDFLLSLDIKNFFPSVHHTRVNRVFTELGAAPFCAGRLTALSTYKYCLPQGAPSSPYIATLALKNLDKRIVKLCAENSLVYSRYFDDIVISGGRRAHGVLTTVGQIVESEGYKVHTGPDKLRFAGRGEEKIVTGIVIKDGQLCTPKADELSFYIEELERTGVLALRSDNPAKERVSLRGKIAFVATVDQKLGASLAKRFESIIW